MAATLAGHVTAGAHASQRQLISRRAQELAASLMRQRPPDWTARDHAKALRLDFSLTLAILERFDVIYARNEADFR